MARNTAALVDHVERVARWDRFGDRTQVTSLTPTQLRDLVLEVTTGWHPHLRRLFQGTGPATIALLPFRTSRRPEPLPATNIAVLGDAIHSMPPTVGANTAIVDSNVLRSQLTAAEGGQLTLDRAIGTYEEDMRDRAFKFVATADRNLRNGINPNRVTLAATRTAFRAMNAVGPVRRRMACGPTPSRRARC